MTFLLRVLASRIASMAIVDGDCLVMRDVGGDTLGVPDGSFEVVGILVGMVRVEVR